MPAPKPARLVPANLAPSPNDHSASADPLDQTTLLAALRGVRDGDFGVRLPRDWTGLPGDIAETVNAVVARNQRLTRDLERVSRAVGRDWKTEQRAVRGDAAGGWAACLEAVNVLIADLTQSQANVRAQLADLTLMATDRDRVLNAVARGDLSQRVALDVDGRPLEGAFLRSGQVVNSMIQTLAIFADQVTTMAREVGTQGKLGGQAQVTGVDGRWKLLTDSVNSMAANLTSQVRAIAEVSTAVTKGDLSRSITVDAQGEMGQLTDTINEMISNLRRTTHKSTEQDWLQTSLARFTRTLQGQRELQTNDELEQKAQAPVRTERRGRAPEAGDGCRDRGAPTESRPADADLQVQVAVPGQHVPRAANTAEQHADPV